MCSRCDGDDKAAGCETGNNLICCIHFYLFIYSFLWLALVCAPLASTFHSLSVNEVLPYQYLSVYVCILLCISDFATQTWTVNIAVRLSQTLCDLHFHCSCRRLWKWQHETTVFCNYTINNRMTVMMLLIITECIWPQYYKAVNNPLACVSRACWLAKLDPKTDQ